MPRPLQPVISARHALGRALRSRKAPPAWFDSRLLRIWTIVRPYTVTSPERVAALVGSVDYIVRSKIPGAIVECGVWKGGSTMAALLALIENGDTEREVYVFDTFEGMPPGGEHDDDMLGQRPDTMALEWTAVRPERVRANLASTGYPDERLHLVAGMVEDTIPDSSPAQIAILRLDTDWYESTRHELRHLVPRMAPNAVIIIDDYGHWKGARKATDEWLDTLETPVLLHRIDYTGVIGVIPGTGRR